MPFEYVMQTQCVGLLCYMYGYVCDILLSELLSVHIYAGHACEWRAIVGCSWNMSLLTSGRDKSWLCFAFFYIGLKCFFHKA